MSIKETITKELLDRIDDPAGLEEVLKRHSRSKGPLYLAIAEATTALGSGLETLVQNRQAIQKELDQLQAQVQSLEERQKVLGQTAQALEKDIGQKEARLSEVQGLIEAADTLQGQGFGEHELKRLFDFLGAVATSQGERAENGIKSFFDVVKQWEGVVSLELQTQRYQVREEKAKAQAERWEAEAKRQEAKTKARAVSIDIIEQILEAGVKATDIPVWQKIINNASVSPDMLAASLEQFGNAERLTKIRQKRVNELTQEEKKLAAGNRALTRENDSLHAAIEAVQVAGVNNIRQVGEEVVLCIRRSGKEARELFSSVTDLLTLKAQLEGETSTLQGEIQVARAIKNNDLQSWQLVPLEVIRILLVGILVWTKARENDIDVPIPESISRASSLSRYAHLSLFQILLWAFYGIMTPQERKALSGGR